MSSGVEPRVTVDESRAGKELTEQMMWLVTGTHGYIHVKHADGTEETYGPGDVDVAAKIPDDAQHVKERFYDKIDIGALDECWNWKTEHASNEQGHGHFWYKEKTRRAHRISYRLHVGPIPGHKQINHKCGNHSCCNPDHLYLGTQKENMQDALRHGSKDREFSESDIREIRRMGCKEDMTQTDIADEFNTTQALISDIVCRNIYRDVE